MKKLKIIWILFALISILIWMPRLDGLLTKEYSAISDCVVLDDGGLLKVRCVFISNIARSACMLMMYSYMNMA